MLGNSASNRVTISNSEIDGKSTWSATCDGHHYWGIYVTGSSDLVTLKGNYIHDTSGRSPKAAGNSLVHAVNNYFAASSDHAFEVDQGGMVLAEGNAFQGVPNPVDKNIGGQLFTSQNGGACQSALGRACQANSLSGSGSFNRADTNFLVNFKGKNIASASAASGVAASVQRNAGVGKI